MAKRLSSLFSLSKEDSASESNSSLPRDSSLPNLNTSPTKSRLHKHKLTSSSEIGGARSAQSPYPPITPLAPPPLLSEDGFVRPPSSLGSGSRPGSRASSPTSTGGFRSRPQTPTIVVPEDANSPGQLQSTSSTPSSKLNKRKSWLPGKGDKARPGDIKHSKAWIAGLKDHVPYDLNPLLQGERVAEMWNERGDTLIYLYPRSSGRGPCFKVDSALFTDSHALRRLRLEATTPSDPGDVYNVVQSHMSHLSVSGSDDYYRGAPAGSRLGALNTHTQEDAHLHLPLEMEHPISVPGEEPKGDDLELIVLYRNFFAFLIGGALVATPRQPSLYAIFLGISSILKRFSFSSPDGSTFGDVPTASFSRYCQELRLADVRSSREKTIEAIVLGEGLRYWPLYNEGFVHAAGRLDDIKHIKSQKISKISPITMNRLERSHMEIEGRLLNVRTKLEDFDFPSMFAGIANSQTATEGRMVRFKAWKEAFIDFRRFILMYYRRKHGAWPPKASSKKNNFEESGLNRLVLQELYKDLTDLYDVLVDQTSMTERTVDMPAMTDAPANDINDTIQHALRVVESEYDRATPPVAPPIPFDVPIIPGFANSFNRTHAVKLAADTKSIGAMKKLKDTEVNEILLGSYNRENINASPFIQDFFNYERKLGQGKTLNEMVDCRCGQWLFMYAVLQALPMTVVDARDIQFKNGVEYFLCIAPRGGRPWMKEDTAQSRAWYNVASGGGMVSLPADLIDHGVEGIYRRSHCWNVATRWVGEGSAVSPADDRPITPSDFPPLGEAFSTPMSHRIPSPMGGGRFSPAASPRLDPRMSPRNLSPTASPLLAPNAGRDREARLSGISNRSSVNIGLEATAPPVQAQRPVSTYNPNITFDSILAGAGGDDGKKGKKKK